MDAFDKHLLICVGPYCEQDGMTPESVKRVGRILIEQGLLASGASTVKPTLAKCLGACGAGPIMCVYPEGVWYSGVTPERFIRIASDHLVEGRVVEDFIFHRGPTCEGRFAERERCRPSA